MTVAFDWKYRLGSGHFGEVWLAKDLGLDTTRAVKLIPPSRVMDPNNFFHEAQILQKARHANVVQVHDTGTLSDGRIYVSMEFLKKGSLDDEAKGAYVALTRAKRVMVDVLRGLQHAHQRNILHRDIKPANILIGPHSEGKLSDFGLALPVGMDPSKLGMKGDMYTMHVPPEVHTGSAYDALGEIYSCGVTLYRLVNGDSYLPPLSANFAAQVVNRKVPNRQMYREFIPRPIRTIINRALHVNPAKRYQDVSSMRRALEQVTTQMNWNEESISDGKRWSAGWDNQVIELVRRRISKDTWEVQLRKGATKRKLRRVTTCCSTLLDKTTAERTSRRILQDFVLGRLK